MSPDVSAFRTDRLDARFAEALRGLDPDAAHHDALGVAVPASTPRPATPPAPTGPMEGLGVRSGVRAGQWESDSPGHRGYWGEAALLGGGRK